MPRLKVFNVAGRKSGQPLSNQTMPIKVFKFVGQECTLGTFGLVRPGDILAMTPKESAGILEDKRFEQLSDDAAEPADIETARQREESQVTREELKAEAETWGVPYNVITSKQELRRRIDEAIAAQLDIKAEPENEPSAESAPESTEPAEQAESEEPKRKRKR